MHAEPIDRALHALFPIRSRVVAGDLQPHHAIRHNPILRDAFHFQRIRGVAVCRKNGKRQFLLFHERINQSRIIINVHGKEKHVRVILELLGQFF